MKNYSLEVKELSPGSDVKSISSQTNATIATELSENTIYVTKVTVWNSVGSVSIDSVLLCKCICISYLIAKFYCIESLID